MGTVLVATVFSQVRFILKDEDGVRWTDPELLTWLNNGQREVVIFKPNACVKNTAIQLAPGTKQALPADGVQLIDIPRNMGAAGTTPGAAVRLVPREILDQAAPNWHASTPSAVVVHFTYNPNDPKTFYTYPPQPATGMGYVDMVYGAMPTDCAIGTGTVITVDDIYESVLIDYVLYRAFSKDTEFAPDPSRAAFHQSAYLSALGGKVKAEAVKNPNTNAPARSKPNG